jgi:hypothetical protein
MRFNRRRRCIEVGAPAGREFIRLDCELFEFRRAVDLVMEYGHFQATAAVPPADGAGSATPGG